MLRINLGGNEMKKVIQRLKNERGLTLVELLAVIVILAIIAVIAFVFVTGIIENSRKDAHISNAQQIISAAKLHEATGGDFSSAVTVQDLIDMDYLDSVKDPWSDKDPYNADAEITKNSDGKFVITGFSVAGKCEGKFAAAAGVSESDLANDDRDTLCGN